MNYFEIINQCLQELNFRKELSFENLIRADHGKLKDIINRVNSEVCSSYDWFFRSKKAEITIPAGAFEIPNTINGKITGVFVEDSKYCYEYDFSKFYNSCQRPFTYSLFDGKILFPPSDKERSATVFYLTNDFAVSADNTFKPAFNQETDVSIIPEVFRAPILVYGSCMRFKALLKHQRFNYWYNEYVKALQNLRSQSRNSAEDEPRIVI